MSDLQSSKVKVTVYGAEWCPPCHITKDYLKQKGVAFEYINVDEQPDEGQKVLEKTGWRSIPIIKIGEEYILGYDRPKIDAALKSANLV